MRPNILIHTAWLLLLLCIFLPPCPSQGLGGEKNGVIWYPWGETAFQRAKSEKKFILLNLRASWCHWCHVMDEKTYANPGVKAFLQKSFVTVAVQQDDHPSLSSRYRQYGWPATVIFNDKAEEVAILSGYIEPEEFEATLRKLVANPSARNDKNQKRFGPHDSSSLEVALNERFRSSLDHTVGGLRTSHRYLDSDSLEYAVRAGIRGDTSSLEWFHKTLEANRALLDPVWGGVYQYSTGRAWMNPHFEKLISSQLTSAYLYFLGHVTDYKEHQYKGELVNVTRYVQNFLSSTYGSFYVSQSAVVDGVEDNSTYFSLGDEERRNLGFPEVDTHEYGRETALGIEALLYAYRALGDESLRNHAIKSGRWLVENRVLSDGFVLHDKSRSSEFFLADSVSTAKAFLHLYSVTGDTVWLRKGEGIVNRIIDSFKAPDGVGFLSTSATVGNDTLQQSIVQHVSLSENLSVGRVVNLYSYYAESQRFRDAARSSMIAVSQPRLAFSTISEPGILLLNEELLRAPIHVTLIGDVEDARTEDLWRVILQIPDFYTQVERFSFKEVQGGSAPGARRIRYPTVSQPAAFLCANKTCSLPIFTPQELRLSVIAAIKNSNKET